MNTGRAVVHVCYHQLWIREDEPEPDFPAASYRYGLLDLANVGAVITTGIHTGAITVSVEVLDTPPSAVLDGWEEVVEASTTANDELYLCPLMDGPPDLPILNPSGPGDYRIRVHANHRGHSWDGTDFEPVEEYLVMAWPAPEAPEIIYRVIDPAAETRRRRSAGN